MSLPPQEGDDKDTFTRIEVDHIVARRVMQHRMDDIERSLERHEETTRRMFDRFNEGISKIESSISQSYASIKECRADLKTEIAAEYATTLELERLESKIKLLSSKIITGVTVAVTVATAAMNLIFRIWL